MNKNISQFGIYMMYFFAHTQYNYNGLTIKQ